MRFLKWIGRVTLWFVFLPVGLWRSVKHGKDRRQTKVLEAIAANQPQPAPLTIRGIPSDELPAAP